MDSTTMCSRRIKRRKLLMAEGWPSQCVSVAVVQTGEYCGDAEADVSTGSTAGVESDAAKGRQG